MDFGQSGSGSEVVLPDFWIQSVKVSRFGFSHILYGPNPETPQDVAALLAAKVTRILDLRSKWEWCGPGRQGQEAIDAINAGSICRLHVPIGDGDKPTLPDLTRAVAFVAAAAREEALVYVHCRAGRQRTGAVVLAWFLTQGGSQKEFERLGPGLAPTFSQVEAVYDWLRSGAGQN